MKTKPNMFIAHSKPTVGQDDIKAVSEVLASGKIAQGEKVNEFERSMANFVGTKYAIACSSGTSALHLALMGLGVGHDDEVIMPSYVCSSPFHATVYTNAIPKVVDIDISDFNICARTTKRQLSQKTKVIIVPHMFGTPAELDEILDLGVPIIEDCAQSLGAGYKGRNVGSVGIMSVFSFYATKMITTGEGGMILTDNQDLYQRVLEMRDYDRKPLSPIKYNYKMTDFQAALGINQMKKLEDFVARRRRLASVYSESFQKYDVVLPCTYASRRSVFFRYVVLVSNVERARNIARESNIYCEKPVFKPLHHSLKIAKCPNSERAYNSALSLPIYPSLGEDEAKFLVEQMSRVFENCSRC